MSLTEGQVIAGKYRLNSLLGQGGMATVWCATNTFTDRQFAVKFLLPTFAQTPEAAQRFMMEAKVSGRVQHANVIEVIDVGQAEDGSLFLVMELLHGDSLEHVIRKQKPPMLVHDFLSVMLDVARALAAAHRAGVIHRDLKPSNIMIHKDREGVAVPKVLDFGVSKFLLEGDRDNSLTIAGTVLGSPLYMSPEQAMGLADLDHRTDLFAFGAILFEALCGFRCYDAPNFNALIVTIATTQPKNVDHYAAHLPESLRALVRNCLVTDKNQRAESFEHIIERLTPIIAEMKAASPMRLPVPVRRPGEPPPDPENTAAMPAIIRPSDRPPPPSSDQRGEQVPGSGSAAPWAGSLPGYRPASKPPVILFAIVGAVLASFVIVVAVGFLIAKRHRSQDVAATQTATAAPPVIELPSATASSSSEVPVVSVDAIPMTQSGKLHVGKLNVEATPQACTISVDGKSRGTTPQFLSDLSPGPHSVRCENSSGIAKIVTVSVVEGQTAHHRFSTSP